jgi:hypothetical protein
VSFFIARKGKKVDLNEDIQKHTDNNPVLKKKIYSVTLPKDTKQCKDCPYPGVGFICWAADGSCMRTEVNRINGPGR